MKFVVTSILLLAPHAVRILWFGVFCQTTDKMLGPETSISEMVSPLKEYWQRRFDSPPAKILSSMKPVTCISFGKSKISNGWRFRRWYRARRGPPPVASHSWLMLADPIQLPKFERFIFALLDGSNANETPFSRWSWKWHIPSSDAVTTSLSLLVNLFELAHIRQNLF